MSTTRVLTLMTLILLCASDLAFAKGDSVITRRSIVIAASFGTVELIDLNAALQLYGGIYIAAEIGRNFVASKNDFLPLYASQFSYGIQWKIFPRVLTPFLATSIGSTSWKVNRTGDPPFGPLPPEEAKLVIVYLGFDITTYDNISGGVAIGRITWNYTNGGSDQRYGIQGYVGVSF